MKAIRYRGAGDFPVVDVPEPTPGPAEVVIKPLAVGICFTDKHVYDGLTGASFGQIGGHEFAGRIEALGPDVHGLTVGEVVSIDPRVSCGRCLRCRAGLATMCVQGPSLLGVSSGRDGGLADLCLVPASGVHRLPAGVTALQAAAAEPACCATRAIRRGGVRIGDNVVIFGAEDYGLYATSWLASAGVNATVVIDPNENRRRAAKAMGATAVLDPREDLATSVAELLPFGADVAIVNFEDYVPESDRYLAQAIEVCRPQGTVITLRAYGNRPYQQLRPHPPWLKEITLKHFGNFFGEEPVQGGRARGDWAVTLQAMADGRLTAPPEGALTVTFDELRGDSDVARMMAALPATATKAFVVME